MVKITCIIVSLILIPSKIFTDTRWHTMSVTSPAPVACHVGKKIRHDKAHRTTDTDMGQFALLNEAAQGAR